MVRGLSLRSVCVEGHIFWGNRKPPPYVLLTVNDLCVSDRSETAGADRPVTLILVEQSGTKRAVPQESEDSGMLEAEQAMHRDGPLLRQVKVVRRHTALARWKAGEEGWRRVA
jgi:hypothetical protein